MYHKTIQELTTNYFKEETIALIVTLVTPRQRFLSKYYEMSGGLDAWEQLGTGAQLSILSGGS